MDTSHHKKTRRRFSPEQKFAILKDIESSATIKDGLKRHQLFPNVYYKWRRQLEVGVQASLRNSKPRQDPALRSLQNENKTLKEMVLNLTHHICELKKTLSLGV